MKNKILFLATFLLIFGSYTNAQSDGLSFGIRGGFDMQTFNGKDHNGDQLKISMVPRFNVGVVVDIPVAPDFYFQPGLLFTTKGAKSQDQFLGLDMSAEYNVSYIELPLSLLYKPVLGNGRLLLGFGPYLAYGIGGKVKYEINNVSSEEDIVYGNEYSSVIANDLKYFKALDFGANLFFGYQLSSGISMQVNTQLGLAKINADNTLITNGKTELKNTGFGLSLGYSF
ncbi:MAG: porin family protein [Bacteroidales bacterium]|nr:porin family protein [Bacteroidales bacterium]